jgi:hypothetical protein
MAYSDWYQVEQENYVICIDLNMNGMNWNGLYVNGMKLNRRNMRMSWI